MTSHWLPTRSLLLRLLNGAGYPLESQVRHVDFFDEHIAPRLGSLPGTSYMTDDGTPVELSWDWGNISGRSPLKRPVIRFSVELEQRMNTRSSDDERTGSIIGLDQSKQVLSLNLGLYQSLATSSLSSSSSASSSSGHSTPEPEDSNLPTLGTFYGFDLGDDANDNLKTQQQEKTMGKAYYFSRSATLSPAAVFLEQVAQPLYRACTGTHTGKLEGLSLFRQWIEESPHNHKDSLEVSMIGVDMTVESRLKIYYRCRDTSFASVVDCLTLGGLLHLPGQALQDLKRLWDAVLDADALARGVDHETAGMLYDIAIRPGGSQPVTKIYIPVRHYGKGRSDAVALEGLLGWIEGMAGGDPGSAGYGFMQRFEEVMRSAFTEEGLENGLGVQTYLGVQVNSGDGSLRVVSYINPQVGKMRGVGCDW